MRLPEELLTATGTKAAGVVELRGSDGNPLREYGTMNQGLYTTCLVLTSPGDIITVSFVLSPGVADYADLVVDGIRRDSASTLRADMSFNRVFKRVCYQGTLNNGRKGGFKSCAMEVRSRNAEKDLVWEGGGSPSAVGTLELQLFRTGDEPSQTARSNNQGNISKDVLNRSKRAPAFVEYVSWRDLNAYLDPSSAPPSFEMGFTDKHQSAKSKVQRVLKEWPGQYSLFASLKFKFCSTADLRALGFKDVPIYYPSQNLGKSEEQSEISSRVDSSEATTTDIDTKDNMDKHIDDDINSSLFVEDPVPKVAPKPDQTTDMRSEATGGFNPQQPTVNSILQFLKSNRRHYLPKKSGSNGHELEPEPSPIWSLRHDPSHLSTADSETSSYQKFAMNAKNSDKDGAKKCAETEIGGTPLSVISDVKYHKAATFLPGLKKIPTHSSWLENSLLGIKESGSEMPFYNGNSLSKSQTEGDESTDDEEALLRRLLRGLEETASEVPPSPPDKPSRQMVAAYEDKMSANPRLSSRHSLGGKTTQSPQLFGSPLSPGCFHFSSSSQVLKSPGNNEREQQADSTTATLGQQFGGHPLGQQVNEDSSMRQESLERSVTPDQANIPVEAHSPKITVQCTIDPNVFSEAQTATEASILESSVLGSHPPHSSPLTFQDGSELRTPPINLPATFSDIQTPGVEHNKSGSDCPKVTQLSAKPPHNSSRNPQGKFAVQSTRGYSGSSDLKPSCEAQGQELTIHDGDNKMETQLRDSAASSLPENETTMNLQVTEERVCHKESMSSSSASPSIAGISDAIEGCSNVTPGKRKAVDENGHTPDISRGPRKTSTSPALRKSQDSEQELNAARIRLAAAEIRKRELVEALESIALSNKARKLNHEAEQIERENLELQARLDALCTDE